ncbi:MAG: hypothetical protein HZC55_26575 [Verrucomicrobia bacterium]|nr:hypothetical protein [Verrucomicrobiota bacterium]
MKPRLLATTAPVALVANRDFRVPDDGWMHLFAFGEVPGPIENPDGSLAEVVQVIDRPAAETVLSGFRSLASQPNFGGVLVDIDHFSLDPEKESRAAMWIDDLQVRDDGVWFRSRITNTGRSLIEGGDYRFISPVLEFPRRTYRTGERVRPVGLHSAGLTNDPRIKGGAPLSNRNSGDAGAGNHETEPNMKNVNKELGLAEDAPETSSVAEIQKIKNRAATAETERDALKRERDGLLAAQVDADLEKYAAVIANRDAVKAQLLANRAGTLAILEGLKQPEAPKADPTRITNRGAAAAPAGTPGREAADAAREAARGARIANRAAELRQTSPRLTRAQAFKQAETELGAA